MHQWKWNDDDDEEDDDDDDDDNDDDDNKCDVFDSHVALCPTFVRNTCSSY